MKFIAAIILCASLPAQAVFQEIWKGYQASSTAILQELEKEAIKNALEVDLSANAWGFELSAGFDDTYLDSLFSFNAQRTITNFYGAKLVKPTFRYGTISFEHSQSRVDISNWNTNFFSTTTVDQLYEARNSIAYSYDIIGREMPLREELAVARNEADSARERLEKAEERLEFFRAYLSAKLQVFRTRLAVDFRKRASNLKSVIYKRYKDGLSREAEYLQALNAELARKQDVAKAESALKESVAVIENVLGREIPETYFERVRWDYVQLSNWKKRLPKKKNPSLEALKAKIALTDKDLERFEDERGHRLTFNAAYTANAYTEDIDDSLYQADFIQPVNDSKQVSLTYTVPLGADYDTAERKRLFIQKKISEAQEKMLLDELGLREKVFLAQLNKYGKAYLLAEEQARVAKKRVELQSRLYLRGLGTFDETVRAEEELLSAKSSLYETLFQFDSTLASYAFVNGALTELLNAYQD